MRAQHHKIYCQTFVPNKDSGHPTVMRSLSTVESHRSRAKLASLGKQWRFRSDFADVLSLLCTRLKLNFLTCDSYAFRPNFYAPAIWRMVERAYSVIPVYPSVCPSISIRVGDGVSNLCLSFSGISNLHLSFSGGGIHVLWTHF